MQKRTVFDMRNQVRLDGTDINLTTIEAAMVSYDNHISSTNPNAHFITNVSGLQAALDGKADNSHTHTEADITDLDKYSQSEVDVLLNNKQDTLTGFTGSATVVTGVDFVNETTTTQTITFSNGIVTGVS